MAVAYRYRWAVELFFRWVKCVLGCRHLLSQGLNGVRIQVSTVSRTVLTFPSAGVFLLEARATFTLP